MLNLTIPSLTLWDEKDEIFRYSPEYKIQLEHSLVSLSKWESKWRKPFLTKEDKTDEETIDYIKCMTITQNVDPDLYSFIQKKELMTIKEYIYSPMTATVINDTEKKSKGGTIITSEIIYYWMISFNIPFECQRWHLNRLLTLIEICNIKNQPKKKMGKRQAMNQQRMLNQARKEKLGTKG